MIDREELLELITVEDVIKILTDMGSEYPKLDPNGNLYFITVCHGGDSYKLHFFTESKFFMCYTCCGSMSLFDVLMNINEWSFSEAFGYVKRFKGIKDTIKLKKGLQKNTSENQDLIFLNKHLYIPNKQQIKLPAFNKNILRIFDSYYPNAWLNEGIKEEIMNYFGIRFYFNQYKAIIPHIDIHGNLVGIRGRNFFQQEIDTGRKYIPITIQGLTYRYPTQFNLYGIYQNEENIKKFKRVIIFESEKSVQKYASYYGQENNITLASLGMNLTLYQRDMILELGVEEVIIAHDKQYLLEYINSDNKNTKQYKEYEKYIKNIIKISKMFINYCNISAILCWDDRLDYKDAPIDKGKEVFEQLCQERYLIDDVDVIEEEMLNG